MACAALVSALCIPEEKKAVSTMAANIQAEKNRRIANMLDFNNKPERADLVKNLMKNSIEEDVLPELSECLAVFEQNFAPLQLAQKVCFDAPMVLRPNFLATSFTGLFSHLSRPLPPRLDGLSAPSPRGFRETTGRKMYCERVKQWQSGPGLIRRGETPENFGCRNAWYNARAATNSAHILMPSYPFRTSLEVFRLKILMF